MGNRRFCMMALAVFLCTAAMAQGVGVEARIDSIKLDESFVYGESYDENAALAYDNALSDLLVTANELRAAQGRDLLAKGSLQVRVKELTYTFGQRNTVFLYIPVDEMLALADKPLGGVVQQASQQQPVQQQQQPVQQPAQQSQQPAQPQGNHYVPSTPQSTVTTPQLPDDVTRTICGQDNWVEIKSFLSEYKHSGKISQTGATKALAEAPADAYAILMDGMGGIISILAPVANGQRAELKANGKTSDNNECKFIVWYK